MTWQWWKEHVGWVLLIIAAGGAPKVWNLISSGTQGFVGISSYLRTRHKNYVSELVAERNELKAANAKLIESHASDIQQLRGDLEDMTRAKDLREDISRQDRDTIRELLRLCDQKGIDYHHVTVHIEPIP